MAAEVVEPMDRGLEPVRRPFRAEQRAKSRRSLYVVRIGRSQSSADKLNTAIDLFRATAKDPGVDRADADRARDGLTRALIEASDALTKTIRRHR